MRPRFAAALAAAALLGLAIPFLAACGGSDRLLPADQAGSLDEALQQVSDNTANGDCGAAIAALRSAQNAYADLPDSIAPKLKARLGEGIAQLARTVPQQCRASKPQTTTTTNTTTSEPPTTTSTTTPTTTGTTEDPGGISPEGTPTTPGTTGATP